MCRRQTNFLLRVYIYICVSLSFFCGGVEMGNSLYSDMIGAKTDKDEDDEMHGKGQISYKDYVEEEDEDEKVMSI